AHERGQDGATVCVWIDADADARLDAVEQRDAEQKALYVFRLVCENFFGEVVEDVAFGLPQDFNQIGRVAFTRAVGECLALRDLADELERGDPAVRALSVFAPLRGR